MARKKVTPESNTPKEPILTSDRKVEIVGLLVMVIALLLAISIVTYAPEDYSVISDSSLGSLLQPDQSASARIHNGLGVVGAYLSHFFVHIFFGYFSIFIAFIALQLGWYTFRHNQISDLQWPSVLIASGMVLVATFVGWFNIEMDAGLELFSGAAGLAVAQIMRGLTGFYGSFILLVAFSIVLMLLLIDRDIQGTVDRVRDWIEGGKNWIEAKRIAREEKRALDAEQKAQSKAEADARSKDASDVRSNEVVEAKRTATTQTAPPSETPVSAAPAGVVALTPQEIAARSTEAEKLRREEARIEESKQQMPDRAILEKNESTNKSDAKDSSEESGSPFGDDDELEIKVYVGEAEEEAREKDLEKEQKAQEIPIIKYKFPTIDLLDTPPAEGNEVDFEEIKENKLVILDKLKRHGIEIIGIEAIVGPTVTLYELQPAPDVKISKIESYANDLKMAMATHGLRIIAPIPGKSAVGIEVPNRKRETVYIKQLINTKKFVESKMALPVAFGKTIENEIYMVDLTTMPHLLIAGATGSGKSVGINTIITCLLYKCHPENLKFVLVDPKKIELALYRYLQKHFLATLPDAEEPIITDTSKVMEALSSVCKEMDDRYDLLKMAMVRDIKAYNEKFKAGALEDDLGHRHLPYIVVIIDELADLMLTAGKAIEEPIARIAQLARAVGIHLVVATQRPSVNVITGTIKANFPVRIAYQVASKIDSRTILDTMGADQLVGRGDMLVSTGGRMVRVQNAFVSTEEVERINAFIGNQVGYNNPYYLPKVEDPNGPDTGIPELDDRDDLFEEAAKVVVLHQQGSVSLIQRKLKLGYNRAGRIIDQLYAAGVVGPYQGSTARDVLIADEDELYEHLRSLDE
jgi:DNA segregation ATPase FtsK/SpoIIIE, S-DNA-T family